MLKAQKHYDEYGIQYKQENAMLLGEGNKK